MKLKRTTILIGLSCLIVSCAEQTSVVKPSAPTSNTAMSVSAKPPETVKKTKTPIRPTPAVADKKIRPGEITGIEMGRVFTMQQAGKILLVDCRPPIFYRLSHIDGAINLPLKSYQALIRDRKQHLDQALAAHKTIVLYCQNTECPDAYGVAKKLITLGYSISIYKGGWEEWKHAGL